MPVFGFPNFLQDTCRKYKQKLKISKATIFKNPLLLMKFYSLRDCELYLETATNLSLQFWIRIYAVTKQNFCQRLCHDIEQVKHHIQRHKYTVFSITYIYNILSSKIN